MPIFATLQPQQLFSSLPPPPSGGGATTPSAAPPIPIPKYPPKPPKKNPPKPIKFDVAPHSGENNDNRRAVVITENGVGYRLPGAPFEFHYSYSETPKVKPLGFREPKFLPFAPPSMPRPWTGKAPLKKPKAKKVKVGEEGVKRVEEGVRYEVRSREEVLGEPLKKWEVTMLVKPVVSDNRQVNLGRDGVTHNMLELIHAHWKTMKVCKVRCKGVPTVDMDNVSSVLEEKTGGKIIHRVGGVIYLFRGRNYDYRTRPRYPIMLWKPATPVYPKLIQDAPAGLTKAEAECLREKGKKLLPICKLSRNGIYITLVKDVRHAFEASPLVKIDCKGMHASDYKKLGAKLKELVPCVLLSFDDEQILMWRGQGWKSMYTETLSVPSPTEINKENCVDSFGNSEDKSCKHDNKTCTSPKMMSLWKSAIKSSKALLLDEIDLGPDNLLKKVEEFEGIRCVREDSCSALILSNNDRSCTSTAKLQCSVDSDNFDEAVKYVDDSDDFYDSDPFDEIDDQPVPLGSLPIDQIAKKLSQI